MSLRWYPRYVKGNPQLRIFLPNMWMILKKVEDLPETHVEFKVPIEMTKWDVRNYLEKIYKIEVKSVNTVAKCGEIKKAPGKLYLIKGDDYKRAIITLPLGQTFKFPDLFPTDKMEYQTKDLKTAKNAEEFEILSEKRKMYSNKRHNVPNWFSI